MLQFWNPIIYILIFPIKCQFWALNFVLDLKKAHLSISNTYFNYNKKKTFFSLKSVEMVAELRGDLCDK